MFENKGQTEIMSVVLLTGIMISLVSAAYFWGRPMLAKQRDLSKIDQMESLMKRINTAIKEVANEGGNRKISATIPANLLFDDADAPKADNLTMQFDASGSIISTGDKIYLTGDKREEPPTTEESGIITVQSTELNNLFEIKMNLHYRNLTTNTGLTRIDLNALGRTRVTQGSTVNVLIENSGSETMGDIVINKINVRIQ